MKIEKLMTNEQNSDRKWNSPNLFYKKCMETLIEKLNVDINLNGLTVNKRELYDFMVTSQKDDNTTFFTGDR